MGRKRQVGQDAAAAVNAVASEKVLGLTPAQACTTHACGSRTSTTVEGFSDTDAACVASAYLPLTPPFLVKINKERRSLMSLMVNIVKHGHENYG